MNRLKGPSEKEKKLLSRMAHLGIKEEDLEERFILGSGRGGQKINKTASCVSLIHRPSKIKIKCQKFRFQSLNRLAARSLLCERLAQKIAQEKFKQVQEREKHRRKTRKPSAKQKKRRLEAKRRKSVLKKKRSRVHIHNGED